MFVFCAHMLMQKISKYLQLFLQNSMVSHTKYKISPRSNISPQPSAVWPSYGLGSWGSTLLLVKYSVYCFGFPLFLCLIRLSTPSLNINAWIANAAHTRTNNELYCLIIASLPNVRIGTYPFSGSGWPSMVQKNDDLYVSIGVHGDS